MKMLSSILLLTQVTLLAVVMCSTTSLSLSSTASLRHERSTNHMRHMMSQYSSVIKDVDGYLLQQHANMRHMLGAAPAVRANPLPQVAPARNNTITVGGFDSGAMMANQMQVAFSATIRGAALSSGVPYACSQGTVAGGTVCMSSPSDVVVDGLAAQTITLATSGQIDPLSGISGQLSVIQGSTNDAVVSPASTAKMADMIVALGQSGVKKNPHASSVEDVPYVTTMYNFTANHAYITSTSGNTCGYLGSPYVSNCGFNFAERSMAMLWSWMGMSPNTTTSASSSSSSSLFLPEIVEFDQTMYGASVSDNSLDTTGFVFVPPQCLPHYKFVNVSRRHPITKEVLEEKVVQGGGEACSIHIHFHGCMQSKSTLGSTYVDMIPITNFAMLNDVIVLFPQAAPNVLKYNPMGCWDWFGYNNGNFLQYATKTGVQMQIVQLMVRSLLAGV